MKAMRILRGMGIIAGLAIGLPAVAQNTNMPTVYFNLRTFASLAQGRALHLDPQANPVTDGTNIYWGLSLVKYPTNGLVVISNLVPNNYKVSLEDVPGDWTLPVPWTNSYLNAVWMSTNLLTYTYGGSAIAGVADYAAVAGTARVATNGPDGFPIRSTNVLFSSIIGCAGNSDLVSGGGTDDTARLQWALDQATNGPIELVIERPSLISTSLVIHANNTTIRGVAPGVGFFRKAGANSPLLWNGWPPTKVTNIVIKDLTFSGNGFNQVATNFFLATSLSNAVEVWPPPGIWFNGGDYITLQNVVVTNCAAYRQGWGMMGQQTMWADVEHLLVENCTFYIDGSGSCDGLHFWRMGDVRLINNVLGWTGQGANSDALISANFAEGTQFVTNYPFMTLTPGTCRSFYVDGMLDRFSKSGSTANGQMISFNTQGDKIGAPASEQFILTNCTIKNVWGNFSDIEGGQMTYGSVGTIQSMVLENIHNCSIAFPTMNIGNLSINGFYCDKALPAGAVGAMTPTSVLAGKNYLDRNNWPHLPLILLSDTHTNVVINNVQGAFNCGYTNAIVQNVLSRSNVDVTLPSVLIDRVNVTGNSPLFSDSAQTVLMSGTNVPPHGAVTVGTIVSSSSFIDTNHPPLVYTTNATTRTVYVPNTLTNGLVAYWKLNETSGTNFTDSSPNGNNGTLPGATPATWSAAGKLNYALSTDASGNVKGGLIPHSTSLNIGGNTISLGCWVKPTAVTGTFQSLISKDNSGGSAAWSLLLPNSTNSIYTAVSGGAGNTVSISSPWVVGVWNHVFVTFSASPARGKVYLNGAEVYSTTSWTAGINQSTDAVNLGVYRGAGLYSLAGIIDDARVYNRELTAAEVAQLYNGGVGREY